MNNFNNSLSPGSIMQRSFSLSICNGAAWLRFLFVSPAVGLCLVVTRNMSPFVSIFLFCQKEICNFWYCIQALLASRRCVCRIMDNRCRNVVLRKRKQFLASLMSQSGLLVLVRTVSLSMLGISTLQRPSRRLKMLCEIMVCLGLVMRVLVLSMGLSAIERLRCSWSWMLCRMIGIMSLMPWCARWIGSAIVLSGPTSKPDRSKYITDCLMIHCFPRVCCFCLPRVAEPGVARVAHMPNVWLLVFLRLFLR